MTAIMDIMDIIGIMRISEYGWRRRHTQGVCLSVGESEHTYGGFIWVWVKAYIHTGVYLSVGEGAHTHTAGISECGWPRRHTQRVYLSVGEGVHTYRGLSECGWRRTHTQGVYLSVRSGHVGSVYLLCQWWKLGNPRLYPLCPLWQS
jgi:hypothetical protein